MHDFKGLYIDVEYMDINALAEVLQLTREGMPICMVRDPKEPGKMKHDKYAEIVQMIRALPNVSNNISIFDAKPLIEGENLPDFWCRKDGGTYYVFFANPMTQTISYPLPYCYAFTDKGSERHITINHHGKSEPITLRFEPMQSILLKINRRGIRQIDLGFVPKMIEK